MHTCTGGITGPKQMPWRPTGWVAEAEKLKPGLIAIWPGNEARHIVYTVGQLATK